MAVNVLAVVVQLQYEIAEFAILAQHVEFVHGIRGVVGVAVNETVKLLLSVDGGGGGTATAADLLAIHVAVNAAVQAVRLAAGHALAQLGRLGLLAVGTRRQALVRATLVAVVAEMFIRTCRAYTEHGMQLLLAFRHKPLLINNLSRIEKIYETKQYFHLFIK